MAILTYHHISDCPADRQEHRGLYVSPELFRAQLSWLAKKGYVSVSLDQIADSITGGKRLPRRWVAITFDDGWRDNFTHGYPALTETGFGATIFLITNQVGRQEPTGSIDDYLTVVDIREMKSAGIQFGSHTHTHPRLTKLPSTHDSGHARYAAQSAGDGLPGDSGTVIYELLESRRRMSEDLGLEADWFCYPYGNFSPRIAQMVKQAGYKGALSTIRDNRPAPGQLYWLPRVMVMNDTQPERLGYMMSHWYHWVHSIKNRKRWKSIK